MCIQTSSMRRLNVIYKIIFSLWTNSDICVALYSPYYLGCTSVTNSFMPTYPSGLRFLIHDSVNAVTARENWILNGLRHFLHENCLLMRSKLAQPGKKCPKPVTSIFAHWAGSTAALHPISTRQRDWMEISDCILFLLRVVLRNTYGSRELPKLIKLVYLTDLTCEAVPPKKLMGNVVKTIWLAINPVV